MVVVSSHVIHVRGNGDQEGALDVVAQGANI